LAFSGRRGGRRTFLGKEILVAGFKNAPQMRDELLNWFAVGEVGASSKAMALQMLGLEHDGSYPHDPDDLRRCVLFLRAVPSARIRLKEMAQCGPIWEALTMAWNELESLLIMEAGYNFDVGETAPVTYAMMRRLIEENE